MKKKNKNNKQEMKKTRRFTNMLKKDKNIIRLELICSEIERETD